MSVSFRKPQTRKQGLKILGYGSDSVGKSFSMLTFPNIAIVDTESKLGVYENDERFNKNLLGVADTINYYEVIELAELVIKNPKTYSTFVIDSETNLYEAMQVASMEVEEEKARKKKKEVDDATVAQRGWGKIKLNNARLRNLKAQMSANGTTIFSLAHKKDITEEINGKNIKIGEKPDLKEGSKHDYDVVLRFFKEKDIVANEFKFFVEVEKDTTNTYKIGTRIENFTYEHFREYIDKDQKNEMITTSYDKAIDSNMEDMRKEQEIFDEILKEFTGLFKTLKEKDKENASRISQLLKSNGIEKYNDPEYIEQLKEVIKEMKNM